MMHMMTPILGVFANPGIPGAPGDLDMKKIRTIPVLGLLLAGITDAAWPSDPLEAVALDPIVVVASKSPRPLSGVAGQVSVIEASQITRHLLEGFEDLLRHEPGLAAETAGTRFGMTGVNIRGIGGNRVAIEVDGVPLRNGFAIGSYSNGGRNLVESDLVERVEVLYGPASSLYGSDALAGVMSITTWDPDELVSQGDGSRWFSLRAGYRGEDRSQVISGLAARASGAHGMLLSATHRQGHESDFANPGGIVTDPRDWQSEDYFFRYHFDTPRQNRLRISAEEFDRESRTQLRSILGYARFGSTTALSGDDRDRSSRLLVDYEFETPGWERGVARVFSTRSETRQLTLEERATAPVPSRYERQFRYDTELQGFELNGFRSFAMGAGEHRLGLGLEYLQTRTEELRDGFQQILADGSIRRTVLGETFPLRDFPNARVTETGVFVQDEIRLGGWDLIPAIRWDRFNVRPRPDAIYLEDFPDAEVVGISESELSPRLGLVRKLGAGWSAYGQYVRGFRAPPHEDVNIGLDIALFRFRALPNPDLRPESSEGFELGMRQFTARRRFSLALFETRYTDFIESRVPIGLDAESGYLLFQSRNVSRARIRGIDLRLEQELGAWWPGWRLNAAVYWSQGDNLANGQALNSVSPPQAILGLSWDAPEARWYAALTGTFTRRQDRIDPSAGPRFETPGYGVLDFAGGYRFSDRLDLRLSVRNLSDRQYWRWADVSQFAAADPMIPLLSRPARNYGLSLRVHW